MTRRIVFALTAAAFTLGAAEPKAILTGDPSSTSRKVSYRETDIVPIAVQTGFSTLIELPKDESILEVAIGNKEDWGVNWTGNLAYLKPGKAGSRTNFNLITASGNVYSFVASETTGNASAHCDLKVFVEPADGSAIAAMKDKPRFVPAEAVEGYRRAAEQAQRELAARVAELAGKSAADKAAIEDAIPASIRHDYKFSPQAKNPFGVTAIYHDAKFTVIEATPKEAPAIYEVLDGKPSLVQFELKEGRYIIPKVLDAGYMRVGKAELRFHRETL